MEFNHINGDKTHSSDPPLPLHGLIRNGQTRLLDGILLLSLSEAPVGRGVGEDGVGHRVGGVALNAVQDVTDRQLGLQEEVELAVGQAHGHVHHSVRTKVHRVRTSGDSQSHSRLNTELIDAVLQKNQMKN